MEVSTTLAVLVSESLKKKKPYIQELVLITKGKVNVSLINKYFVHIKQ